ncbi:MAG: phenylalanine--tRNA ligase subunit beta [bacterium]|nr:phenylalanine--tRNA ligase subunit beta [bacterium]MDZ4284627.1 phenylalanine--tRNA ligase subunit beta [Patescibacteria group bacterium]
MKISYNWLQSFFDQKLPQPREVAEALTMHSFEVEALREADKDTIFDIDILPNRAHDCLAHYGVAREVSTLFNLPLSRAPLTAVLPEWPASSRLFVSIEDAHLCPRYSALVIENIAVAPSPEWLIERLRAIGERSINNIVDAMNYVMFDIGQPLHAFDLEQFAVSEGAVAISVRGARENEKITTLEGLECALPQGTLLVTDASTNAALGIAGIKGGSSTAIRPETEHIIIEAANFDPVLIRKSSRALGIRTAASVRFEHGLALDLTLHALREAAALIQKIAATSETRIEGYVDSRGEADGAAQERGRPITISIGDVGGVLGAAFTEDDVAATLKRLGFSFSAAADGNFFVTPPFERLDIGAKEDLAEEIGRVWGYGRLTPQPPRPPEQSPEMNKRFAYTSAIRHLLARQGFSEVYMYAFAGAGAVELANPLASDKKFLRDSLVPGIIGALEQNLANMDFLGLERVRIFEIGTVFRAEGERLVLALAAGERQSRSGIHTPEEELDRTLTSLRELCGEVFLKKNVGVREVGKNRAIYEVGMEKVNLAEAFESFTVLSMQPWRESSSEHARFQAISPYPFVVRDIALWVEVGSGLPAEARLATRELGEARAEAGARAKAEKLEFGFVTDEVRGSIEKAAGDLLVGIRLFDTFEKEGRTSYAFRLVFQSSARTLTDEEVNYQMWQITQALGEHDGFEVR